MTPTYAEPQGVLTQPELPLPETRTLGGDMDQLTRQSVFDRLQKLVSDNHHFETIREQNQKLRKLDPAELELAAAASSEDAGKLPSGDFIVPMHLIQKMIKRISPDIYGYIVTPTRMAAFTAIDDQHFNASTLEAEFTRVFRYKGWKKPLMSAVYSALLHGWGGVEHTFDPTTPGNFSFNYVRYADLVFDQGAKSIHDCDYVMVSKYLTLPQIEKLKTLQGANVTAIENLLVKQKGPNRSKLAHVYRVYHKAPDKPYVQTFWVDMAQTEYLIAPCDLFCGQWRRPEPVTQMVPTPVGLDPMTNMPLMLPMPVTTQPPDERAYETAYPLFVLQAELSDDEALQSSRGQAFWSRQIQKAQSTLLSGFISKEARAANVYGALDLTNVPPSSDLKTLTPIKHGNIYDKPVKFFSSEGGSPTTLAAIQYLDSAHADEVGQVAFSVTNRKDARKTAKEFEIAQGAQEQNKTELLDAVAEWMGDIINFTYLVLKSRATLDVPGCTFARSPQVKQLLAVNYTITPAGSIDIQLRAEKAALLERYLPLAQAAGGNVTQMYLKRMFEVIFPDEQFSQLIEQDNSLRLGIQSALQLLQATTSPQEFQTLPPQMQQQFVQVMQQLTALVQNGTQNPAGQPVQQAAPGVG